MSEKKSFFVRNKKMCIFFLKMLLVQTVILCVFVRLWVLASPINLQDTISIDVIVEETLYVRGINEYKFIIISDSVEYVFPSRPDFSQASNAELCSKISTGDLVSIIYCERNDIYGNKNYVVDARTAKEEFRSLEKYNSGAKKTLFFLKMVFSSIEIFLIIVVCLYIWFNKNTFKKLF